MPEYTFRAGFDVYSPKLRAPYLDNYVMGASGSAIIKISLGMWRFGSYFFWISWYNNRSLSSNVRGDIKSSLECGQFGLFIY